MNSVLSKLKLLFMTSDVNNFYLNTLLDRPKHMRIAVNMSPEEVMDSIMEKHLWRTDKYTLKSIKEYMG